MEVLAKVCSVNISHGNLFNQNTDQIVWIEDQEKNSRQHLLFTWFHNFGQPGRHRQKWNLYL